MFVSGGDDSRDALLPTTPHVLTHLPRVPQPCVPASIGIAADPAWVAKFSTAAAGPEQFWLSYGATPDSMLLGWLTADMTAPTTVQYGTSSGSYTKTASGNASFYKYSSSYTSGLIHHVPLTGLAPATVYYYLVAGATQEHSFTSSPGVGQIFPYTMGIFADIGENSDADSTVAHMIAGAGSIDSYLLNGDISYATGCEARGCITWDAFQRMMSPLACCKPIGIAIGNHEQGEEKIHILPHPRPHLLTLTSTPPPHPPPLRPRR